ncbi:hypothetical protein ACLOAV_002804 [Pseudogymnoascus australis]
MGLLRIPRQDGQEGFVLVHIAPLAQKAAATLDVKILATEGSAPFAFTCKLPLPLWPGRSLRGIPNQIQKLKSKKAPCTDSEWEAILEVILLQQESDPEKAAAAEGIEVEAAIEEDVAVELIFKKSTSGITQRLGSLRLPHDEDQEIELFDWCGASILHSHALTSTLKSAQADLHKEQAKSQRLAEQLEELIKAKGENEHVLLEKFALLLNEKKAKIRELKVEEKKGAARRGKRKAETVEPEEAEEMDVDEEPGKEEGATRDTSDDQSTADEDEDEEPVPAKRGGGRGGKAEPVDQAMDQDGSATESEDDGL